MKRRKKGDSIKELVKMSVNSCLGLVLFDKLYSSNKLEFLRNNLARDLGRDIRCLELSERRLCK